MKQAFAMYSDGCAIDTSTEMEDGMFHNTSTKRNEPVYFSM